jgi:hypothetical protein
LNNISGLLYKMETGPGIRISLPTTTPTAAAAPIRVPIGERLAAMNPGITLDIFWIVAKLSFAVYFLSRGASAYRTAVLSVSAFIIFLYQAGIVGGAPVRGKFSEDLLQSLFTRTISNISSRTSATGTSTTCCPELASARATVRRRGRTTSAI